MSCTLSNTFAYMQCKWYKFFHDERGDVNIVSIVVLIGIAIALAFAFRGQIATLLGNIFKKINGQVDHVTEEVTIP